MAHRLLVLMFLTAVYHNSNAFRCYNNVTINGQTMSSGPTDCKNFPNFATSSPQCVYAEAMVDGLPSTQTQTCLTEELKEQCGTTISRGNEKVKICCCDKPLCNDYDFVTTCGSCVIQTSVLFVSFAFIIGKLMAWSWNDTAPLRHEKLEPTSSPAFFLMIKLIEGARYSLTIIKPGTHGTVVWGISKFTEVDFIDTVMFLFTEIKTFKQNQD